MKLITIKMTDKEFDLWWRAINDQVERFEDQTMPYITAVTGMSVANCFKGFFGLPEEAFDKIHKASKHMGKEEEDVASMWRIIKSVLKG